MTIYGPNSNSKAATVANSQARQGADSVKRIERPNTRAPAFVPRLGKREQQSLSRGQVIAGVGGDSPLMRPNLLCNLYGIECASGHLQRLKPFELMVDALTNELNGADESYSQVNSGVSEVAERLPVESALFELMSQRIKRQELFSMVPRANRVPFTPRIG